MSFQLLILKPTFVVQSAVVCLLSVNFVVRPFTITDFQLIKKS